MAHVVDAVIQLRDEFSATIENASNKLAESHKQMLRTGRQIQRTGRDLMRTGSNLTKSLTLPLVAAGTAAVKVGIDMEDAFSGVKKTISGTPEQLAAIKDELDTMATQSIPVARKELYGIAETAGQLGVAREHITDFTETIAKIGRVTNLSYEEGSASLARFANIMGMPMTEMERLGSTIVKLDTSLATSANEIVGMGMRLAGAGKQAGLTEAQVLGLAGALSSVGLEAQAGGSAFSKVLLSMNSAIFSGGEELRRFAKVAGVSATEFATMWREDAAGATTAFIQGLNKLKTEGKNVTGIIEGLGFKELRTRDALLRATEASDLFADSLAKGSEAWEENTALQEVFATRTDNTAAKIDLMKNKLGLASEKLASSLIPHVNKGIDAVGRLADKFVALNPQQQDLIVRFGAIAAAVGPVTWGVGKLTNTVGKAITTVGNMGKSIKKAGGIMKAIMSPGNKVALIIAGIGLAAYFIYKNWDKIGPFFERIWSRVKPIFDAMGTAATWVGNAFGGASEWIQITWGSMVTRFAKLSRRLREALKRNAGVIKGVAVVLGTMFGPALIKTGVQAVAAGAKVAAGFTANVIRGGIAAVKTAGQITAQFVGSLVKTSAQAVVTGATVSVNLVKQIGLAGVTAVKTGAKIAGGLVVSLVQYAAQGWQTLTAITATTAAWVAQKATLIAGTVATKLATAAQWALNVAMNANPVGLVITLIGGLVVALVALYKHCEPVRKAMDVMWNGIKRGAVGTINLIISGLNLLVRGLNKLSFEAPDWVPLIGGKKWGFDIPEIPKLARGTDYHQGGPALVGERGPELVILPRATRVIPADETARMLSGTATVTQQVIPATIPAVRDQIQRIRQEVIPTIVEAPMALVQTVRQELVEVAIPAVRDQIQRIRQEVIPAIVEAPIALMQMVRQELIEVAIPAVRGQVQKITQQVIPAIVEAPIALMQMVRQELIEVAIPAVRGQVQKITQQVIRAPVPHVADQQQLIRQVVVEATPGRAQTIRQVLEQSEPAGAPAASAGRERQTAVIRDREAKASVSPNYTWAPTFNLGPISSEVDARRLLAEIEDIVEETARNMPRVALEGVR